MAVEGFLPRVEQLLLLAGRRGRILCLFHSTDKGQFLLLYEAVRTATDPDQTLLDFLHTVYQATAERGDCDRAVLVADPRRWDVERRTPTLTSE